MIPFTQLLFPHDYASHLNPIRLGKSLISHPLRLLRHQLIVINIIIYGVIKPLVPGFH